LERYLLIALIIIGFFLIGFFIYLVISNRQLDIEEEIERVDTMLDTAVSAESVEGE
jgi:hypothetical protein